MATQHVTNLLTVLETEVSLPYSHNSTTSLYAPWIKSKILVSSSLNIDYNIITIYI